MNDIEALHRAALAEGFVDETCSHCGTLFPAHVHFIRCERRPCPMISTKNTRTILERLGDARTGKDKG